MNLLNLLGSWTFISSSSWSWPESESLVSYKNHVAPRDVPTLVSTSERLKADGYRFKNEPVRVIRNESTKNGTETVSYKVLGFAHFIKSDGKLTVEIEGNGYPTVEEAVINSTTTIRRVFYDGEPIEGGKGQLKRCREIALRLFAEHGKHLISDGTVIVPYHTRGGRGGWKAKVASRRFPVRELQALCA